LGALIRTRGKDKFVFKDKLGACWQDIYKKVNVKRSKSKNRSKSKKRKICRGGIKKIFIMPLKKTSVSSKFTYKRWHPILHIYRPHLGIDFRGRMGTPLYAVNDGKIVYAGWMRGYGKVTKIDIKGVMYLFMLIKVKLRSKLESL